MKNMQEHKYKTTFHDFSTAMILNDTVDGLRSWI